MTPKPPPPGGAAPIRVWQLPIRLLHWALAASVVAAWVTTEVGVGWHQPAGWAALAAVVTRLAWSAFGNRYAQPAGFMRGPLATLHYAALALRGRAPRYVGHNPLGAWMIAALVACVALLAFTGWLYTTDRFWGDATVERIHVAAAWSMAVLALLHVAGVAVASLRHHENLIGAMLHGMKRAPRDGDVD